MRLTSKGQVTIPEAIRNRLGLLPHTEVEFDIVGTACGSGRRRRRVRRAAVAGMPLLTRDPRRYRANFPKLRIVAP